MRDTLDIWTSGANDRGQLGNGSTQWGDVNPTPTGANPNVKIDLAVMGDNVSGRVLKQYDAQDPMPDKLILTNYHYCPVCLAEKRLAVGQICDSCGMGVIVSADQYLQLDRNGAYAYYDFFLNLHYSRGQETLKAEDLILWSSSDAFTVGDDWKVTLNPDDRYASSVLTLSDRMGNVIHRMELEYRQTDITPYTDTSVVASPMVSSTKDFSVALMSDGHESSPEIMCSGTHARAMLPRVLYMTMPLSRSCSKPSGDEHSIIMERKMPLSADRDLPTCRELDSMRANGSRTPAKATADVNSNVVKQAINDCISRI